MILKLKKVLDFMKNRAKIAFFCQKICIIQKKAVPLHSLLKRRKNCPKSAQAVLR